jgi:hypothetical protein
VISGSGATVCLIEAGMKILLLMLSGLLAACGSTGGAVGASVSASPSGAAYNPQIDPANFVALVDNPLYPLKPGTVWEYTVKKETTTEKVVITVTRDTKKILGVTTTVVHDVVTEGGQVVEDTLDWYAQDRQGNVWYFGEATTKSEGGKSSTEGSWQAGVNGARPGFIMEAHPKVGDSYRQEYAPGVAEDRADVLSLNESVTVRKGSFAGCLRTKDYSPLKPDLVENKVFCPGVGQVLVVHVKGPVEREELVAITLPSHLLLIGG